MSILTPRFLSVSRIVCPFLIVIALTSCTTKSKSKAQARAAFVAGQQQAIARMLQPREPMVRVVGDVHNHILPWTEDLTVARAVIAAGYAGRVDPRVILIVRNAQEIRIDPRQLLGGEDVPLESGDVLEIRE